MDISTMIPVIAATVDDIEVATSESMAMNDMVE